jgi:hypothetical protein
LDVDVTTSIALRFEMQIGAQAILFRRKSKRSRSVLDGFLVVTAEVMGVSRIARCVDDKLKACSYGHGRILFFLTIHHKVGEPPLHPLQWSREDVVMNRGKPLMCLRPVKPTSWA